MASGGGYGTREVFPSGGVVVGFEEVDPVFISLVNSHCRDQVIGREADRGRHDGEAGGFVGDPRYEVPVKAAIYRSGAEGTAFFSVRLRGGQKNEGVMLAVHDVVGSGCDAGLAQQWKIERALPGFAAVVGIKEERRSLVGVGEAERHRETRILKVDGIGDGDGGFSSLRWRQ